MKHVEINKYEGLKEAIEENTVNGEVTLTLDGEDKYVMLDVDIYEALLEDLTSRNEEMFNIPTDVDVRVEGVNLANFNLDLSSEEFENLKEKVIEALEKQFKPNRKYN